MFSENNTMEYLNVINGVLYGIIGDMRETMLQDYREASRPTRQVRREDKCGFMVRSKEAFDAKMSRGINELNQGLGVSWSDVKTEINEMIRGYEVQDRMVP